MFRHSFFFFCHFLFKTDHSLGGNNSEGVSVERIVSLFLVGGLCLFLLLNTMGRYHEVSVRSVMLYNSVKQQTY